MAIPDEIQYGSGWLSVYAQTGYRRQSCQRKLINTDLLCAAQVDPFSERSGRQVV